MAGRMPKQAGHGKHRGTARDPKRADTACYYYYYYHYYHYYHYACY